MKKKKREEVYHYDVNMQLNVGLFKRTLECAARYNENICNYDFAKEIRTLKDSLQEKYEDGTMDIIEII